MIRPRVRVAASGRRLPLNTCRIGERQAVNLQNRVDELERQAGGDAVSHLDGFDRVPKRDLVGAVQVVLQTGRLKIAPGLREARTLARELQNFRMKITDKAHDTYGAWRDGEHDDLVLAVSLALWSGEHFGAPATPEEQQEMVDALTNYRGR